MVMTFEQHVAKQYLATYHHSRAQWQQVLNCFILYYVSMQKF